jgi:adenylate cyclase class 2
MYEVEMKVRADHGPVRQRLDTAGATEAGVVAQEDTYYDAPHRDFAETDEALRLRREAPAAHTEDPAAALAGGGEARLAYKGPLVETASKTREEFETGVESGAAAGAVLDHLGFSPAATVRKTRERYRLDGYLVALDRVDGLGEYVEVEQTADADEVEAVREGARSTLDGLGLDPAEQIRTSYLGLLLDNREE